MRLFAMTLVAVIAVAPTPRARTSVPRAAALPDFVYPDGAFHDVFAFDRRMSDVLRQRRATR